MRVLIREVQKKDVEDAVKIIASASTEGPLEDEYTVDSFDSESWRKMLKRRFDFFGNMLWNLVKMFKGEPFKVFVAEIDGKVVGSFFVGLSGEVATELYAAVHPDFRRKGIATELMKASLNDLRKKGGKVVGHILSTNYSSKKWHYKFGFKKSEELTCLYSRINSIKSFPEACSGVQTRDYDERLDLNSVYELIKHSSGPTLNISNVEKENLRARIKSTIRKVVKHIMRAPANVARIVAIDDEKLVGYATLRFARRNRLGQITRVHVVPEIKSKMITRALIQAGIGCIKSLGAQRVLVKIPSRDEELIRTLEKLGFRKIFVTEEFVLDFGRTRKGAEYVQIQV